MLDIMCNAKQSGMITNKTKSKQNNEDIIESFDTTKSDKNNNKQSGASIVSLVEVNSLKSELTIVQKALDDQQTLIINLENELKTKNQAIDKKEIQIQSLNQAIGKLKKVVIKICNHFLILDASDKSKLLDLAKYILHNFGSKNDLTAIAVANEATQNNNRVVLLLIFILHLIHLSSRVNLFRLC